MSLGAWQRQVDSLRMVLPHEGLVQALAMTPDGSPVTAMRDVEASMVRRVAPRFR